MRALLRVRGPGRRRGAVAVFLAISITIIMGMAALAIDLGALYSAQAELQRAADSSALAAAGRLVGEGVEDPEQEALETAREYAEKNDVLNEMLHVSSEADIELGKATMNAMTGRFDFSPGASPVDAVRVTLRRDEASAGGPVQLMFARFLGHDSTALRARATAVLVPRDIAVVIDISNSMCWDSQLRFWNRTDGGYANTRDVWAALDGPEASRPYNPSNSEGSSEYAGDSGPSFGRMTNWGNPLDPASYSASADPGLVYIKKSSALSATVKTALDAQLAAAGYSADERNILTSTSNDSNSTHWKNRACVLLGLATWKSGRSGGLYPSGSSGAGDGDSLIESGETAFVSYPSWRVGSWTWHNYIDYVQSNSSYNNSDNGSSVFRYRYGLKTFTDFLLESKPENSNNNNLWQTPELPLRAIKDAVQAMMDTISEQDTMDHVSLEVFASTARHERNLTDILQNVPDRMYQLQSGHYDRATNIGGGIAMAIGELQSSRARSNAHKVIVLMSDGVPNILPDGTSTYDGDPAAMQYARDQAQLAYDAGFRIYCVSVGYNVDRVLMQEIAAIGGGQEFYAAGNPEEYTEELEDIFRSLGGKRPVALIE